MQDIIKCKNCLNVKLYTNSLPPTPLDKLRFFSYSITILQNNVENLQKRIPSYYNDMQLSMESKLHLISQNKRDELNRILL